MNRRDTYSRGRSKKKLFKRTLVIVSILLAFSFLCSPNQVSVVAADTNTTTDVINALGVETLSPTDIGENEATLELNATGFGESDNATTWFTYGKEKVDEETSTKATINELGEYRIDISDLDPGTEYEYRAVIDNGSETEYGETRSFETDEEDTGYVPAPGDDGDELSPPKVEVTEIKRASASEVVVEFKVTNEGDYDQEYIISYWLENIYEQQINHQSFSKFLEPGESYNETARFEVGENGDYIFNIEVQYGDEVSVSEKNVVVGEDKLVRYGLVGVLLIGLVFVGYLLVKEQHEE